MRCLISALAGNYLQTEILPANAAATLGLRKYQAPRELHGPDLPSLRMRRRPNSSLSTSSAMPASRLSDAVLASRAKAWACRSALQAFPCCPAVDKGRYNPDLNRALLLLWDEKVFQCFSILLIALQSRRLLCQQIRYSINESNIGQASSLRLTWLRISMCRPLMTCAKTTA